MTDSGVRVVRCEDACEEAAEHLRSAGFVVKNVSRVSEASYWHIPGMSGVLRLAWHRGDKSGRAGLDQIHGRVTLAADSGRPMHIAISQPMLRLRVAQAIGCYILGQSSESA